MEHTHTHAHDIELKGCNNEKEKEIKTLTILLDHWVEHNKSHEKSFKEWVEKSKQLGKNDVGENIEKAIEYMEKSNEMLVEAKKYI